MSSHSNDTQGTHISTQQQPQHHSKRFLNLFSRVPSTRREELSGLPDLFGRYHLRNQSSRVSGVANHCNNQHSFLQDTFFTLRIEHREGGTLSRHPGEERFLLFRSDRAGAIAKVIFSSTIDSRDDSAKAKVHVLDVKSEYRGKDLGGLLFTHAMNALMQRYEGESVACQLDAEEDVQRYDRLLQFYQDLGCEVKSKAKMQYINNNDGETYRKIPMVIQVNSSCNQRTQHQASMLGARFLPVQLLEAAGNRAGIDDSSLLLGEQDASRRRIDWLLVDDGAGCIQFRTTVGHYLRANEFGHCSAVEEQDDFCFYFLYRVSDGVLDRDDFESEQVRRMELWVLQSTHGGFLTIDGQSLACSKAPSFWQADEHALSLSCTSDTPSRRQHYRQYWAKQTVVYVQEMRQRYLSFQLAKMTLRQALNLVEAVPCHPYVQRKGPSMRTLCFRAAEFARNAGQPDWVQLIALIHELGVVVNLIDSKTAIESADGYDWSRASRSHVIGCGAPDRASFAEFRFLNADSRENAITPQGIYDLQCGLKNLSLAWTGPEYLFHMLKHNEALIPDEGLSMLRYFSLGDWHTHNEYSHLTNQDDGDLKSFVAEFDTLRRSARKECDEDMACDECDHLWNDHYQQIASKYGLSGMLEW